MILLPIFKELTNHQILLLSKGLSFVPTPRDSSHFKLLRDFNKFCNRIRSLSLIGTNKPMAKKFPLKRIFKRFIAKRTLLSTPKLEGVLKAIKIEISQIPLTYQTIFPVANESCFRVANESCFRNSYMTKTL